MTDRSAPLVIRAGAVAARAVTAVACVAALGVPRASHAQSVPRPVFPADATLVYTLRGDTLGTETVEVRGDTIGGVLRLRGTPRIAWRDVLRADAAPVLFLDAWPPSAGENAPAAQRLALTIEGDSGVVLLRVSDVMPTRPAQRVPARAGARWLVNQSLAHVAHLVRNRTTPDSLVVILASGARTLTGAVTTHGDTTRFSLGGVGTEIITDARGLVTSIRVPAQQLVATVAGSDEAAAAAGKARPDYAAPADAPYTAREVRVPSVDDVVLAGTLTVPTNATGPVPAVITISGSGPQERDEEIPGVVDYRPFRDLADTLGRRGIALLRFDERGTGASTGQYAGATSRDLARDVASLLAWLRTQPGIAADRIALVGHSEGGLIAPLVATAHVSGDASPRVAPPAALVLLAGPAYAGAEIVAFQQREAIAAAEAFTTEAARDSAFREAQRMLDSLRATDPWMREFLAYDPRPALRALRVPLLVLQGETDRQVTPEQADSIGALARTGGNADVTVRRLPATNHLFQRDAFDPADGLGPVPARYARLPDRRITRETLGIVTDWLVARLHP